MSDELQKKRKWMLNVISTKDEERCEEMLLAIWRREAGLEARSQSEIKQRVERTPQKTPFQLPAARTTGPQTHEGVQNTEREPEQDAGNEKEHRVGRPSRFIPMLSRFKAISV